MNIVAPESLLLWTTLIFVILVFLLRKFAWKPIMGAVNSREESINNALEAAEKAKIEMANLQADNEKLLKEARAERDQMLTEARQLRDKMLNESKEMAKAEGDKMILSAREAIRNEKAAAMSEIRDQVAELSLDIAEKVVKSELSDKEKQMKLIDNMLEGAKLN
ncbi:MAG TPA: F0F1 ATP synthase subunit B [Flavobacteriaceae bacterium]|nr:F0F1 ATP synthase subunit B [Flavobacteriaceae bacterium]